MHEKTSAELVESGEDMLQLVEQGLEWFSSDAKEKRLAGLRNVLVFGRACLLAISALRRRHPGFDDWYEQNWAGLRDDPAMKDFERVRQLVLKDARPGGVITQLMVRSAGRGYGAPPKNARAFFTGDRLGGTGWEVVMPDESIEKYYVALSEAVRPRGFGFRDEGVAADACLDPMMEKYVAHLREMLRSAREHFA
ncbi:MAG: hypothetical protein HYU52_12845 [Acidobacteria bacterium]|nr:hypothetical protein [Acidobacteriota bacterium]